MFHLTGPTVSLATITSFRYNERYCFSSVKVTGKCMEQKAGMMNPCCNNTFFQVFVSLRYIRATQYFTCKQLAGLLCDIHRCGFLKKTPPCGLFACYHAMDLFKRPKIFSLARQTTYHSISIEVKKSPNLRQFSGWHFYRMLSLEQALPWFVTPSLVSNEKRLRDTPKKTTIK